MIVELLVGLAGLTSSAAVVQFDRFSYGPGFEGSSSSLISIASSKDISEVCEGESFKLECKSGEVIKLAKHLAVRFGRNGDWEKFTRCGAEDVRHCTEVNAKRLLQHCNQLNSCTVTLTGDFKGVVDPCPAPPPTDGNINAMSSVVPQRPRKYLTVKYSCVQEPPLHSGPPPFSFTDLEDIIENRSSFGEGILETDTDQVIHQIASSDSITEQLKDTVSLYLERMMGQVKVMTRMDQALSPVSILNHTSRVSMELQNLLNRQDAEADCEIRTSEMTLKVIKKQFSQEDQGGRTDWKTDNSRIILPDQIELVEEDELKITLASFRNLNAELASASDVITVSVNRPVNLSRPLTFLLANNGTQNVSCAYWSFLQGLWAKDGCRTVCHNATHTKCSCDHLTNFALIFNVHEDFVANQGQHSVRLTVITCAGFSISILCLGLTLVLFLVHRSSCTDRDIIHVNLCLSLLTAEVVFLFGIQETENTSLCTAIACLLHFLFLSAFAWMLLEGYQIYILLVKVFENSESSRNKNLLVGYLVPLCIVVLSFCVDYINQTPSEEEKKDMCYQEHTRSSYGTRDYCWLRVDNHFILSFVIPAVLVILSNFCFLIFAVHSMLVHKQSTGATNRGLLVSYVKGVGVLLCLLGSTWISGLLYIAFNSIVLAYTFTILNSLQGVGMFLFLGVLNPTIQTTIRRRFHGTLQSLGIGDLMTVSSSRTQGSELIEKDSGKRGDKWKDVKEEIENVEEAFIHSYTYEVNK